jgi:signal peptidase I
MSVESRTKSDDELLREAESFVERLQERLDRDSRIPDDVRVRLQTLSNELRQAISEEDAEVARSKLADARALASEHLEAPKSALREYAESIGLAILFALFLRGFVIEAFKIPTGSMIPTLLIGDHLFVNKFIYGIRVPFTQTYVVRFSEPERGEVVVFSFPNEEARAHIAEQPVSQRDCIDHSALDEEKDFIKRIVGVAGDTIELKDNHLFVNGSPVERTFLRRKVTGNYMYPHQIREREKLDGHAYTIQYAGGDLNFGPVRVEEGHVFVMGDNRDNSSDSRCWGQVPVENIKGRAMIIWWSIGPESMRWERVGRAIH